MAALHEIARQYAEEIRDGIAWVIIWKTGRSWHAESVWLNQDSDTFELEDLSTATEILEQDPNAVMVNGYYCGHFGENMTIAELEAGILWHYEGGCNLLKTRRPSLLSRYHARKISRQICHGTARKPPRNRIHIYSTAT